MEYKKCTVNGIIYGENDDEVESEKNSEEEENLRTKGMLSDQVKITKKLMKNAEKYEDGAALLRYYTLLAVCHTVVVDEDPVTKQKTFSASSPDELALTKGASSVGI